jgi:drug/metabolite transporter (DMT)-like permease
LKTNDIHSTRTGLLYALSGFALLSVGDAVVKTMADEWSALAVAALRFSIAAIVLSVILRIREGSAAFRPTNPWLQIARGACLAIASVCFFSAIFVMPLAEAMAIGFLAPILTVILSGPLLGERVKPAFWMATLVALAGVAMILRPNLAELGWAAILPLISACFFALMMIANRASAGQGSSLSMQVFIAGVASPILVMAATFANLTGIPKLEFGFPDWSIVLRCAIIALTASTAHWLAYMGTMRAGASQVAPAVYVQILVATGLGWWWFGDVPDLTTLLGSALIIASGLYLWREGG